WNPPAILEQPVPQRVLTDLPSSGQPGGRGRRFGHAAAGPRCDRNRPDVGTATETRPAPMAGDQPFYMTGPLA
ncbi:MAG TPA: hypothetical protein VH307_30520, partial [Streptosporangiaceae bacterium]|nr:hypothetical protein [Streptosporangiaceae bacterium]